MKRYWYVLIEQYNSGAVKAAITRTTVADVRPDDFYEQMPERVIYGEWVDSEFEAESIVADIRELNAGLVVGKGKAA